MRRCEPTVWKVRELELTMTNVLALAERAAVIDEAASRKSCERRAKPTERIVSFAVRLKGGAVKMRGLT